MPKKRYHYFVSYNWQGTLEKISEQGMTETIITSGFGSIKISIDEPMTNYENILKVQDYISKLQNNTISIILNFIRLDE